MYEIFNIVMIASFSLICAYLIIKYFSKRKKKVNHYIDFILNIIDKYHITFLIFIFVIFLITRIIYLGIIPNGIHMDEAGMAYDAYSLSKYGVDRYLNPYPIYLINYGSGQSAMYAYIAAIFIKIFGFSIMSVRMPAVLFGIITFIFGYLLTKKIWNKNIGLITATIITICPYFIINQRWGLDCNLMCGMLTMSLYFAYNTLDKRKIIDFVIGGLSFGLTLYSYAISYIIVPLILIVSLIYLIYLKKIKLKEVIAFILPLIILAAPLILMILINMGYINEIKTKYFTIPKLPIFRGSEMHLQSFLTNWYQMINYLIGDGSIYNSVNKFGTFYLFSIPIILIGFIIGVRKLYYSLKNKKLDYYGLFTLIFISYLICLTFFRGSFIIYKGNGLFIFLSIFLTVGLIRIFKFNKQTIILMFIVYLCSFLCFTNFYFKEYSSEETKEKYDDAYYNAIKYANTFNKEIYIDHRGGLQIYAMLGSLISPYEYNKASNPYREFGNIHFYLTDKLSKENIYVIHKDKFKEFTNQNFNCKEIEGLFVCQK